MCIQTLCLCQGFQLIEVHDFCQNASKVHKSVIISAMYPLSQYVHFSYTSSVYIGCSPCFHKSESPAH